MHGNTIEVMLLCIGIEVSLQEIEVLYMSCTCSYNFTDGLCYHTSKNLHANHQQSTCYPPHTHWLVFLLSLCSSCSPLDDGNTASQPFLACLSWECCCPSVGTVGYKHNNRRRRRRRRRWRRLRKEKKKRRNKKITKMKVRKTNGGKSKLLTVPSASKMPSLIFIWGSEWSGRGWSQSASAEQIPYSMNKVSKSDLRESAQ